MPKRSKRLQRIKDLASLSEEIAAKNLAEQQNVLKTLTKRLADLEQYRKEYQARCLDIGQEGISGTQLQHFQGFIHQIDRFIHQQTHQIKTGQQKLNQAKDNWQAAHTKTMSLEKMVNLFHKQEIKQSEREEQKQIDDLIRNKLNSLTSLTRSSGKN